MIAVGATTVWNSSWVKFSAPLIQENKHSFIKILKDVGMALAKLGKQGEYIYQKTGDNGIR